MSISSWLKSNDTPVLVAGAILFALIFIAFFPPFYASIDEHEYVKNAHLVASSGSLETPNNTQYCWSKPLENGNYISGYPIGKSISLIPFLPLPFEWVFLSGLLIHLINFFILASIFKKMGLPSTYAFLYLIFPAFVWESRTLYSELLVATFFLGAYRAWLSPGNRGAAVAGALLGAALFVRYDAGLALASLSLYSFFWERKRILSLLAGAAIPVGLLLAFNNFTHGGFFNTGYGSAG
ncbi:MAG: hypothetical protein AABY11_01175, partial [archaeon]